MSGAGTRPGQRNRNKTLILLMHLPGLVRKIYPKRFGAVAPSQQTHQVDPQMDDCIFCRRDDPALNTIVCDNTTFFARYDNYPSASGHVQIVSKRHTESFFELTDQELLDAYALILEARKMLIEEYDPPHGYTIGVNEGRAAGRSVDHLHIHLIPRYFGDVKDARGGIRQATPNWDPDSWR
jgi:diadenosine tetraphosphate (Ap4A) HIT family hydrolase